jgi:hypothetical protein
MRSRFRSVRPQEQATRISELWGITPSCCGHHDTRNLMQLLVVPLSLVTTILARGFEAAVLSRSVANSGSGHSSDGGSDSGRARCDYAIDPSPRMQRACSDLFLLREHCSADPRLRFSHSHQRPNDAGSKNLCSTEHLLPRLPIGHTAEVLCIYIFPPEPDSLVTELSHRWRFYS